MFEREIKLVGKHATYLKFLSKKTKQLNKDFAGAEIFKRYIDVYIVGVIVGLVKKLKADVDADSDSASIFADAVISEQFKLKALYRMVQLLDNPSLSPDERIDLAFRYDTDEEKVQEGMKTFNSYARGGIEWLYDTLTSKAKTKDEYLESVYNMVNEFYDDYMVEI